MFVFSYPPLSHQLVALFSFFFEEETSYKLVQGLALAAFPVAMWLFVKENIGKAYADNAALLSIVVPSIYVMLYAFGQLPSFLGMTLALAALGCFGRYVRLGTISPLVGWIFLIGAAAATHHHTVMIIVPGLVGILVVQQWLTHPVPWASLLVRQGSALLGAAVAGLIVIFPFVWWVQYYNQPQVEIPHPTRGNIFSEPLYAELFFWGIYGSLMIAGPIAMVVTVRLRRDLFLLVLGIITLALLGLGTLTPLPKMIFGLGNIWQWLTYERFAIWASVLSVIPISIWTVSARNRTAMLAIMIPVVIVLLGVVAREATLSQSTPLVPPQLASWEEEEIIKFLEGDNHDQWNYITLGMGEAQMARLSRKTEARTIDGTYYTARQREELRNAGIPSIDSSIWQEHTREILVSILSHPEAWHLKWAVIAKPEFNYLLIEAGWVRVHPLGSNSSFRAGGTQLSTVWIWQVPESYYVEPRPTATEPYYPKFYTLIWGIFPLMYLIVGSAGLVWTMKKP